MIKDCPKRNSYFTQPKNQEKEGREDHMTITVKEEKEETMETEEDMTEMKAAEATEDVTMEETEATKDVMNVAEVAAMTTKAADKEAIQAEEDI